MGPGRIEGRHVGVAVENGRETWVELGRMDGRHLGVVGENWRETRGCGWGEWKGGRGL